MANNRSPLIDALRGTALLGIILVNVHAFMGLSPGGYFGQFDSFTTGLDKLTVGILGFAAQGKFYPIFCFCFGFGIAVQARQLRLAGLDAKQGLTRRLKFLLGLGLLHGCFIWPGDVLSTYAMAGFVLRNHTRSPVATLLKLLKRHALFTLLIFSVLYCVLQLGSGDTTQDEKALKDFLAVRQIYLTGSFWAITAAKLTEFLTILLMGLLILPTFCFLIILGMAVGRYAQLINSRRVEHIWQKNKVWLLPVSLLTAVLHAYFTLQTAQSYSLDNLEWWLIGTIANPLISACYVLLFARWALANPSARLLNWLAAAGQLSLSNYLLQSIILCLLLHPYGLGLGGKFQQFGLTSLAIAVYLLLAIVSVQYRRLGRAGPFESLWRRYKK